MSDSTSRNGGSRLDRRDLLKLGLGAAGAAALGGLAWPRAALGDGPPPTPLRFTPFSQDLPLPSALTPVDPFPTAVPLDSASPAAFYEVHMRRGLAEIIPGVETPILGYTTAGQPGQYPGPSIFGKAGRQDVVRHVNELDIETSIHQHGGHNAPDFDGYPNDFIEPGKTPFAFKDYLYPNEPAGGDPNDNPSTLWYHDHAMDITGPNVYAGLAGLYPSTDALEDELVDQARHVLPATAFDVPLVLQDRRFNPDGSLFYDPFSHDGFLGDVYVVNGKAQPRFHVQPRRYRFRLLNGANARIFMLRLSNGAPFLQVGADSWLLPFAIQRNRILLAMAQRADVIVDFSGASGSEVFLENILVQDSGRGPGGDLRKPDVRVPGVPLVKFIVDLPLGDEREATIQAGQEVRPHSRILPNEIKATRTFEFNRSNGAWQINSRFFDPNRTDASPVLGTAERWILKNGGGGWWHPIHIHDEAHQVVSFNGRPVPPDQQFKSDTTLLGPGDQAEVFMRFREFRGRYVFHCHNIEHEDMRMMGRFDVR
jgi:spore coat protein A